MVYDRRSVTVQWSCEMIVPWIVLFVHVFQVVVARSADGRPVGGWGKVGHGAPSRPGGSEGLGAHGAPGRSGGGGRKGADGADGRPGVSGGKGGGGDGADGRSGGGERMTTQTQYKATGRDEAKKYLKKKYDRSTSSSSAERQAGSGSADSLGEKETESYEEVQIRQPGEAQGWRKWHRKCTPCKHEMALKWRDPSIRWICGGYQRARRSFKSTCMMEYRNCQDGTMFVKIAEHRCNEQAPGYNGGRHFFYDYAVSLPDDSSSKESESSSEETYSESFSSN